MEAEQREEWAVLERQAVERLRNGSEGKRESVKPIFQMLELPSFQAAISWEICENAWEDCDCFAIRSVWQQEQDMAKLETPVIRLRSPRPLVPTIEISHVPLEAEWVHGKQTELQSLLIPAVVNLESAGCDGTFYELAFNELFVQARYRWWEEPPSGWRPLHQWFQQTLEALKVFAHGAQ